MKSLGERSRLVGWLRGWEVASNDTKLMGDDSYEECFYDYQCGGKSAHLVWPSVGAKRRILWVISLAARHKTFNFDAIGSTPI